MPGTDGKSQIIVEISQMITGLSKVVPEDLVREDILGKELNFRDVLPDVKKILKLFIELGDCDLEYLPINLLVTIRDIGEKIFSNLDNINNFSIQSNQNPTQMRNRIIENISESYAEIYLSISPVIAYAARRGISSKLYEEKANNILDNLQSSIDNKFSNTTRVFNDIILKHENESKNILENMATSLTEIKTIQDKIRLAAQEVAVAAHSIHFKKEADEHRNAAYIWLFVTAIFAIGAIYFGIYNYRHFADISDKITTHQNIQLVVAKIIVFSLFLTGVVWSGRIYRANRHNYIINKHRHNALNTFEAFAKSTEDEQIKSAVLLQTTQCIFSQQHSGYITQEGETGGAPQIMEIIRGISSPPPKS